MSGAALNFKNIVFSVSWNEKNHPNYFNLLTYKVKTFISKHAISIYKF